jgi:hypothetical protein
MNVKKEIYTKLGVQLPHAEFEKERIFEVLKLMRNCQPPSKDQWLDEISGFTGCPTQSVVSPAVMAPG